MPLDLARHAVTLPGWRWMPGMLAIFRGNWTQPTQMEARVEIEQYLDGTQGGPGYMDDGTDLGFEPLPPDALPDLSDPATLGCLLALVREAHPGAHAEPNGAAEWDGRDAAERDHWWAVYAPGAGRISTGPTEAAALVMALGVARA